MLLEAALLAYVLIPSHKYNIIRILLQRVDQISDVTAISYHLK
jgi:hypothetical protein